MVLIGNSRSVLPTCAAGECLGFTVGFRVLGLGFRA